MVTKAIKAQTPAEGILVNHNWGSTKSYKVVCDCGSDEHSHNVWVEASDTGVTVTVYTKLTSKWWSMDRWQKIWQLLIKGHIELEECIMLSDQQAINYAETLKSAVKDVQEFKRK
jgi:hypothetical protein